VRMTSGGGGQHLPDSVKACNTVAQKGGGSAATLRRSSRRASPRDSKDGRTWKDRLCIVGSTGDIC